MSSETGSTEPVPPERGIDMARRALTEAREAAKARGKSVGQGRASPGRVVRRRSAWSGPGPDSRDPQPFGRLTAMVSKQRGWSDKTAAGMVLGSWQSVVGDDIAGHADPVSLTDGVLTIVAESTAWATQLRLMQRQIIQKIAAAVGHGIVTSVKILGPTAPSWRKGDRHVKGRGPRDTYG